MRRATAAIALGVMLLVGGCGRAPESAALPDGAAAGKVCDCELSSWVVAGRGRHLYLTIDCPEGFDELDGVVEFTSEALRRNYTELRDASGALVAPRVARMTRGVRLRPVVGDPKERVEARWAITVAQARGLEADRVWVTPYVLIGANSNSAMASALRSAGLAPGIDVPLGPLEHRE